jgi:hypothetical protein
LRAAAALRPAPLVCSATFLPARFRKRSIHRTDSSVAIAALPTIADDVGGYRLVARLNFRRSESGAARNTGGRHSTRQNPDEDSTPGPQLGTGAICSSGMTRSGIGLPRNRRRQA